MLHPEVYSVQATVSKIKNLDNRSVTVCNPLKVTIYIEIKGSKKLRGIWNCKVRTTLDKSSFDFGNLSFSLLLQLR